MKKIGFLYAVLILASIIGLFIVILRNFFREYIPPSYTKPLSNAESVFIVIILGIIIFLSITEKKKRKN
jgi:hypothetical protein